ncbi:unnamed protein product [Urochloa decumbens]|uniref:Late embryogenesis abundant protein LEA-2 subgroup domain-containing protein n=1 Tax=Urochloa decumbens TaxID=240449 RepID=A0ABC9F4A4_9POAL
MDEKLLSEARRDGDDNQPSLPTTPRKFTVAESVAALLLLIGIFTLPVVLIVSLFHAAYIESTNPFLPPTISIAADGCSGLGARAPRAFNFTVAIDNPGGRFAHDVCVGGDAAVLYSGVPLAAGRVEERCVPPGGAAAVAVRTASGGVGVPAELAALMAEEERATGAVPMEVRIMTAQESLWCKAIIMGGGAAAQPSPCHRWSVQDQSDGFV